jgi:hypothetical protein
MAQTKSTPTTQKNKGQKSTTNTIEANEFN